MFSLYARKTIQATTIIVFIINILLPTATAASQFCSELSIPAPTQVAELIYSPDYHTLVLKNSASAIMTVDISTQKITTHLSNWQFTNMSVSPSGRYVFAADYGSENIGYGTPANSSYVHRLDLSTNTWETKTAYIAGHIQAVSDDQFVLSSLDQWVTFTNNSWGSGSAVVTLNTSINTYWGPGYYAGVYAGDFRYEPLSGRLLHGDTGSSSQEIQAFRIVANEFQKQEGSGTYGSAQGYGGTVALASDSSAFYYGSLQVDPLDVTHNLKVFLEPIYAATGDIAFGNGNYYDAHTAALIGSLGFSTTRYGLNPADSDFWAFDSGQNLLRYFFLSSSPCATSSTTTTTSTTTTSSTTTTTLVAGPDIYFVNGWNLAGNGMEEPINASTSFDDTNKVVSVWKWTLSGETAGVTYPTWAFYSPQLSDGGQSYAASHGYEFLTTINGGEGFWLYAKTPFSAGLPNGALVQSTNFIPETGSHALKSGWNLIATGDSPSPILFNTRISAQPPSAGVIESNCTTMWAWNPTQANWYFWAPALANTGDLWSYIATKGYLDFTWMEATPIGTLSPTTGFWINMP